MKKRFLPIHAPFALGLGLAASQGAMGATIEYWDFEDGPIGGGPLTPEGEANGSGYTEGLNGNRIHGWNATGGAAWTTDTSPNGGSLGLGSTNQDGYIFDGDTGETILGWTNPSWTLEMHVRIDDLNGWETIFARMGSSYGVNESDIYFQRKDVNAGGAGLGGQFRLNYVPYLENAATDADRIILDSATVLEQGTWYGIAVAADSAAGTVSMFLDDGSGYSLESQITGITPGSDLGLTPGTNNYAFFRDYFGGSETNRTTGVIDNVRFSDVALGSGDLIPLVPEPSSTLLIAFGGMGLLRRRRR